MLDKHQFTRMVFNSAAIFILHTYPTLQHLAYISSCLMKSTNYIVMLKFIRIESRRLKFCVRYAEKRKFHFRISIIKFLSVWPMSWFFICSYLVKSDGQSSLNSTPLQCGADSLFIQYEACANHSRQNGTGRRPLIGYYASALSAYLQCIARCSMFTGITPAKSTKQTTGGMQPSA